jgi:hypothetical protein
MGYRGDDRYEQDQPWQRGEGTPSRSPGYGSGYGSPAVPQQFQQGPPPRQDGTRGYPAGYGQPEPWQQAYQPPAQQYQATMRPAPRHRQGGGYGPWIAVGAVVLVAVAGGAFYVLHGRSATPSAATAAPAEQAAAQPETEAGVRSAATAFYALYSAGQWPQAWAGLSPATQQAVPEATWAAVHQQCTSATAGLAREIKGITMAGSTAVVTETVAGALGKLGTVADAWSYTGGRWGLALPASSTAIFAHGSVKADVAASKAEGDCAS